MDNCPSPSQQSHVPIFVVSVSLPVSARDPVQLLPDDAVFDGVDVGVLHDDIGELDVEGVVGAGPDAEDNGAVEDAGEGKEHVVVFEEVGPEPEEQGARQRIEEDGERGGGVVEEAGHVAELLEES